MPHNNLGNPRLRKAVRIALTGGTIAASFGVAHSQEQPPSPPVADNNTLPANEVVVTGSRIAAPNAVSAVSPITVVSSADIAQSGAVRVEDLLNELPQVFADQGSSISNGSNGTSTVNLRGLNAKRTLVLVDGFRLGYGDPRTGGAGSDISQIPTALIDSVEVLTGGASSTYGADAVAGVVNFKLNDHFEGVKLVADGGIYQHNNTNDQNVESDLAYFNSATGNSFAEAPGSVTHRRLQAVDLHRRLELAGRQWQRRDGLCELSQCRGGAAVEVLLQRLYVRVRLHWPVGRWPGGRSVRLLGLLDRLSGPVLPIHRRHQRQHRRCGRHADPVHQRGSLQLRSFELLPASGRAVHRRRLPALSVQRPRGSLFADHVLR